MSESLLLTGCDGYVGRSLTERLRRAVAVVGVSRRGQGTVTCDLLDREAVARLAADVQPTWIVHAAGNKNIAACEAAPQLAYDANVTTLLNVLSAWPGVPVFYISTDYVFSGSDGRYSESSPVAPRTAYGRSKVCAEAAGRLFAPTTFTSLRVSALYDESAAFIRLLSTELPAGRTVSCFADAYYSPTLMGDFADMLLRLMRARQRPPVLHIAGERTNRFAFARRYAAAFGFDADLIVPERLAPSSLTFFPDLSLDASLAAQWGFTATAYRTALEQMAQQTERARRAA